MGADTKNRYRTPGPGAYDVRRASRQCLKVSPSTSFGGSLNKIDRLKTGPLKVVGDKHYVPGPCAYAVEAEDQARGLCERSQTLIFGRSTRDDLSKLFLGKDAVAYITSRTPGPGAYELGWQRPFSLFPAREPGPTIGGPLANVDRVQTGPLGPSYRSFTPGPGAYDDDHDCGVRTAPPRRSRRSGGGGGYSTRHGCSTSSHTRASTSGSLTSESAETYRPISQDAEHHRTPERHRASNRRSAEDGDGFPLAGCPDEGGSRGGVFSKGPDSRFTLSPFRFIDEQGHDNGQLRLPGRLRPRPKRRVAGPDRRGVRAVRSRSPVRNADGTRVNGSTGSRSPTSRGGVLSSSLSVSTGRSHSSCWQSSSIARPASTFGTGTREQAGQVLAPGFKGEAPRSVIGNPGPGAYRNVPGSLGAQVDSTLLTATASSFSQSGRLRITRDTGVPGPGAYKVDSSLGCQISSTCATAPVPKFGTSVRCALEDGLVG